MRGDGELEMGSFDGTTAQVVVTTVGALIALGLVVFYLVMLLARRIWRWITGSGKAVSKEAARSADSVIIPLPLSRDVTSADFLVVKSNLMAVMRQIEDLERRSRAQGANQNDTNVLRMRHG
jgi:hypothetical protein